MRETLQLHASIIDRNHHIQTMVRTITCQVPEVSGSDNHVAASAAGSATDQMRMAATAASSAGLNQQQSLSSSVAFQWPLVELSEAKMTCSSALKKGGSSSVSTNKAAASKRTSFDLLVVSLTLSLLKGSCMLTTLRDAQLI